MLFGKGGKGPGNGKQSPLVIVALVVVILIPIGLLAKNIFFKPKPDPQMMMGPMMGPMGPMMPGAQGGPGGPGGPGMMGPGGPAAPGAQPGAQPAAQPVAQPDSAPAPEANPASAPAGPATAPAMPGRPGPGPAPAAGKPAQADKGWPSLKVFGAVDVKYPPSWGVGLQTSATTAVFTDQKASFEVRTPDAKADNAKAIAQAAVKAVAPGGTVTAESVVKVANTDAYAYNVKLGGQTLRIVGVDAPTRVVLVARAGSGQFAAYSGTFDRILGGISISQ